MKYVNLRVDGISIPLLFYQEQHTLHLHLRVSRN